MKYSGYLKAIFGIILINNKVVSVVVKSYTLNKEEISKIQNIIERELEVETKNINISNKF